MVTWRLLLLCRCDRLISSHCGCGTTAPAGRRPIPHRAQLMGDYCVDDADDPPCVRPAAPTVTSLAAVPLPAGPSAAPALLPLGGTPDTLAHLPLVALARAGLPATGTPAGAYALVAGMPSTYTVPSMAAPTARPSLAAAAKLGLPLLSCGPIHHSRLSPSSSNMGARVAYGRRPLPSCACSLTLLRSAADHVPPNVCVYLFTMHNFSEASSVLHDCIELYQPLVSVHPQEGHHALSRLCFVVLRLSL